MLFFDAAFESAPHLKVMKEVLTHVFCTPKGHRKSKPFLDHTLCFYWCASGQSPPTPHSPLCVAFPSLPGAVDNGRKPWSDVAASRLSAALRRRLDNRVWFRNYQAIWPEGKSKEPPELVEARTTQPDGLVSISTRSQGPAAQAPSKLRLPPLRRLVMALTVRFASLCPGAGWTSHGDEPDSDLCGVVPGAGAVVERGLRFAQHREEAPEGQERLELRAQGALSIPLAQCPAAPPGKENMRLIRVGLCFLWCRRSVRSTSARSTWRSGTTSLTC